MESSNWIKLEVLLDKINLLFASLKESGQPAEMELKLLERYVNDFQANIKNLPSETTIPPSIPIAPSPEEKPTSPPPPTFETPQEPEEKPEVKTEEAYDEESGSIIFLPSEENNQAEAKDESADVEEAQKRTLDFQPEEPDDLKHDQSISQKEESPKETPEQPTHEEVMKNLNNLQQKKRPLIAEGEEEDSLNDRFKAAQPDLADRLKQKPIKDLSKDIDLNDKFWFINELFSGNGEAYKNAIHKLNGMGSKTEAENFIDQELKPQYDWSGKDRIYNKFKRVVGLRYA